MLLITDAKHGLHLCEVECPPQHLGARGGGSLSAVHLVNGRVDYCRFGWSATHLQIMLRCESHFVLFALFELFLGFGINGREKRGEFRMSLDPDTLDNVDFKPVCNAKTRVKFLCEILN
ncbi:hypothetical protein CDAR_273601 [Caerostris darwini]|uniref:Uncharacterized protein n=1 Tax=Caerostris darwini TaxID=1538125 RepID=A0AAV4SEA0_9ARAC|nr:hypothetical protein CDAR_273601 [Caerostris darwini]